MAVVVVWGLMVATFLTLVVVPSMYYLLEKAFLRFQERPKAH
jgi:multidrug efflux pump subunit AcrB